MSKHIVIVGGGAALAQPLIDHWGKGSEWQVTVVCRSKTPVHPCAGMVIKRRVTEIHEPWDVLVTLTGDVDNAPLSLMTDYQWRMAIEANLTHPFEALRYLLPHAREQANVVVVGSIVGSIGSRGCANYAAAKAGLIGLVRAAANEYAYKSLCTNLLELGYMDVGMGSRLQPEVRDKALSTIPLKRFGTVEDFVLAVEFLSKTRYMSGGVLTLAGGLR